MSSSLFGSVDRLESAMTFHRERQTVLSGNVANVDTPGYEPFDIARVVSAGEQEPGGAGTVGMAKTQEGHLDAGGAATGGYQTFSDPTSHGADGNGVALERELAKIDANRLRYSTASELVSRRLAMLRYAAGDGNG